MTQFQFTKATKKRAKARVALDGPSGAGKTYTALIVAIALANGGKIAVIDTERESASLYAGELIPGTTQRMEFDALALHNFNPANYVQAIEAAEAGGYAVIVIDSLSHAWEGEGGALEMVDNIAAKSQSKNSYFAWRDVTPVHRKLVDAMLQSPCHIVATMRSKTEYIIETSSNGKQVPRKIGMAPIQRAGMEYEFTVLGDMNLDHQIVISKSRCSALADKVEMKPGLKFWSTLTDWLNSGDAVTEPTGMPPESHQPAAPKVEAPAPKLTTPEPPKKSNGKSEPPSDALRASWTRLYQSADKLKLDTQPWPTNISAEDAQHRTGELLKLVIVRAEEAVKAVDGGIPEEVYKGLSDVTDPEQKKVYNQRVIALAVEYFEAGKVVLEDA